MILVALALAAASALALNWGFFAQHAEAAALPPLSPRHPIRSLRLLVTARRWLAGFLAGAGGWVLYVAALAFGPLSLVQATSRRLASARGRASRPRVRSASRRPG